MRIGAFVLLEFSAEVVNLSLALRFAGSFTETWLLFARGACRSNPQHDVASNPDVRPHPLRLLFDRLCTELFA